MSLTLTRRGLDAPGDGGGGESWPPPSISLTRRGLDAEPDGEKDGGVDIDGNVREGFGVGDGEAADDDSGADLAEDTCGAWEASCGAIETKRKNMTSPSCGEAPIFLHRSGIFQ